MLSYDHSCYSFSAPEADRDVKLLKGKSRFGFLIGLKDGES